MLDGELVINPSSADLERSTLDMVVAGTADAIMMVEAGGTRDSFKYYESGAPKVAFMNTSGP